MYLSIECRFVYDLCFPLSQLAIVTATVQGVAVLEVTMQPQALTPHFLSTRTRDIGASVSSAIYSTFLRAGLLDESGFLQDDPR